MFGILARTVLGADGVEVRWRTAALGAARPGRRPAGQHERLVDGLYGEEPPAWGANAVQRAHQLAAQAVPRSG